MGIENFSEIRTNGFYYIDKTSLIRDLLNAWGKVNLFTRPRRFGKTLNMSMLKAFFELGCDRSLFEGLAIAEESALCEEYMGKFPVISISLKGVEAPDFVTSRRLIVQTIREEAERQYDLATSERLIPSEREAYLRLLDADMNDETLYCSLRTLSRLLWKHYGAKTIILIDEYDVPLAKANELGYYEQMTHLIRNMFDQALKTNDALHFAVMTGCLRVAKESIFTGLNNLNVLSITSVRFDEYFGFTDQEVQSMLGYYGLMDKYTEIKEWYDGYRFGNVDVYCPWDVISYCYELTWDRSAMPKDYWSNTSGNETVRHFIEKSDRGSTRSEIEALIAGETVTKEIHEDLTYNRLYDSIDNIWSVLFATGYLTQRGRPEGKWYQLAIPNREVRDIFTEQIMAMFRENVAKDGESLHKFCDALQSGDAAEVEKQFGTYLLKTISIRDTFVQKPTKENFPPGKATTKGSKRQNPSVCFYHGILLGILGYKDGWDVKSNREFGDGFSDICIKIEEEDIGIIIEIKYAENRQLDAECREALRQIDEKAYVSELESDGYHTIYKYGIACFKKKCRVLCEQEPRI